MAIELFNDGKHMCIMFDDLSDEGGDVAVQSNQFLIVDHGHAAFPPLGPQVPPGHHALPAAEGTGGTDIEGFGGGGVGHGLGLAGDPTAMPRFAGEKKAARELGGLLHLGERSDRSRQAQQDVEAGPCRARNRLRGPALQWRPLAGRTRRPAPGEWASAGSAEPADRGQRDQLEVEDDEQDGEQDR